MLVLNDIYLIYVWLGIAVTTTSEAITALTMLRENKDKFDLVIADMHMPDMNGLELLELVGLEMELPEFPVICKRGICHIIFQLLIFFPVSSFPLSFIDIIINR